MIVLHFPTTKDLFLYLECEVLSNIDHPSIIKTFRFFFGDIEHEPSILLENCKSNLKKSVKNLSNEARCQIIIEISSAMKSVHEAGIMHRDLKLVNILLDADDHTKVSDFGLCMMIEQESLTGSRTQLAGTLNYMAPELVRGRKDYDEKVDVYPFGVVVFMIFTKGQKPDVSIADVADGNMAEIPMSVSKFASNLISRCWEKEPFKRPSFAGIYDLLKGNEN